MPITENNTIKISLFFVVYFFSARALLKIRVLLNSMIMARNREVPSHSCWISILAESRMESSNTKYTTPLP